MIFALSKDAPAIISIIYFENINKIKDEDYYQLYKLLEPKIKRNKERMFSLLENDPFNPYINLYQKYIN